MGPIDLASVGVETMQLAVEIGCKEKIIGDGDGGNRPADFAVGPDQGRGAVGLAGIDAHE